MAPSSDPSITTFLARRRVLKNLGIGVLALAPGARALAAAAAEPAGAATARQLSFVHTHTGEELSVTYFQGGRYVPAALTRLNELLRDFRTEDVHPIDPQLLDRLHSLQCATGCNGAFEVISAYRSPVTNAGLAGRSSGVADKSLHIEGKAIDVRLPGVATRKLALLARQQQQGGVGFYRVSDFVHVDTGRTRIWGDPV